MAKFKTPTKDQFFQAVYELANCIRPAFATSPLNQKKQFSADQVRVKLNRLYDDSFSGEDTSTLCQEFLVKGTVRGYYDLSGFTK